MSIISQFYAALACGLPLNIKVSEDVTLYAFEPVNELHGINDFRKNHQCHFVLNFPDRVVDNKAVAIKKGNYGPTGGWPHMHGLHLAGGWLGLALTGKKLSSG